MAKRWTCVEAGCSWTVVTPDSESAVLAAQEHIAGVHGSFELEEMIEDVLEDVDDDSMIDSTTPHA